MTVSDRTWKEFCERKAELSLCLEKIYSCIANPPFPRNKLIDKGLNDVYPMMQELQKKLDAIKQEAEDYCAHEWPKTWEWEDRKWQS